MQRLITLAGLAVVVLAGAWLFEAKFTTPVDSYAACVKAGYPISDTQPPICSDGRHTYSGPRPTPAASVAPADSVAFDLLVDGDSRSQYPKQQEHITTEAGWEAYWGRIHAAVSPPPLLPVDFRTQDVVALSEGVQTTSGYSLRITSIDRSAAGSSVRVTEMVPTISCPVTQTQTNRYYIVRTEKLTEPVSFRITTEKRHC
jgi:hypothetical protein